MKQADAKKCLSEKSKKIIFLIAVFVIITSMISFTFAWYIDRKTDVGVIQFGAIEIDRTGSFFQTSPITNLIPGESFVSQISFKKTERSSNFYSRLKIEFRVATSNLVPGMQALVDELNAAGPQTLYSSSTYTWRRENGFYYLVKKSDTNYMYPVTSQTPIIFLQQWIYDTKYEQFFDADGNVLQYQKELEVVVTVQAIQQAYLAENINVGTSDQGTENIKYSTIAPYFTELT